MTVHLILSVTEGFLQNLSLANASKILKLNQNQNLKLHIKW